MIHHCEDGYWSLWKNYCDLFFVCFIPQIYVPQVCFHFAIPLFMFTAAQLKVNNTYFKVFTAYVAYSVLSLHLCLFLLYMEKSIIWGILCLLFMPSTCFLLSSPLIGYLITGLRGGQIIRLGLYIFAHSGLHWAFLVFLFLTHISLYASSMFLLFMSFYVFLSGFLSLSYFAAAAAFIHMFCCTTTSNVVHIHFTPQRF